MGRSTRRQTRPRALSGPAGVRSRARSAARRLTGAAAGVAVALAGCAAGPSEATVAFWSFTGIDQGEQVERYLAAHPQARITLSEVGSSTETADALTAALAGGNAPDLVLVQGEDLPRFAAAPQHFRDLREFGADRLADQYLPWAWDAATTDTGKVIGIPTDVGGMALAYRADLFAQAGLPTDPDEVAELWPTWAEFVRVGERFAARSDAAFIDNVSTTVFVNGVNQLPVKYYNEAGELDITGNAGIGAAFEVALDAHDAGLSAGLPAFTPAWSAGMAGGDFAVMAAPSWMLRVIKSTAPATSGRWRITSVPGVSGNWGGSYLVIPATSRNAAAAWDYVAATQSGSSQDDHFTGGGPLPAAVAPYAGEGIAAYADPFFGPSDIGRVLTRSIIDRPPVRQGPATSTVNLAFLQTLEAVEQGSLAAGSSWEAALAAIAVAVPPSVAESH